MNQVIRFYQELFGLLGSTFVRIEHSDAMVAEVYKIIDPQGRELILKISRRPRNYHQEVYFLNYFANLLPVPKIIAEREGAILMECLPGDLPKEIPEKLAFELGSLLARVHLNHVSGNGDLLLPFTLKFEENLSECENYLPKERLKKYRQYFESHVNLLASCDGPCIVHRDYRPGNVIVAEGRVQGIIDWASAREGFAEEDFCPLEHGGWPEESKEPFLAGYASVRNVPDYREVMPLLRLNKSLATVGFILKQGIESHSELMQRNCNFLEEFYKWM